MAVSFLRMRQLWDAAADWTSADPTMYSGELGFESDTQLFKIGDGSTAWSSLNYAATPYDVGLVNLASVSMAANKAYYTTADNTHAAMDVTEFARSILDDSNEATFKATVNLEIGTDVQAYGAILDDLNTLGAVASDGQMLVGTGEGAFAWESGATLRTSIGVDASGTAAGLIGTHESTYNHTNYNTAYSHSQLTSGNPHSVTPTELSLVIGTNTQAYDVGLTDLASVAMSADKFYYTTADNTHAAATVTSAARSILDDTTVGAIRTTLGVGIADSPAFTGLDITGISDGIIPYIAAGGFANTQIYYDGSHMAINNSSSLLRQFEIKDSGSGLPLGLYSAISGDGGGPGMAFETDTTGSTRNIIGQLAVVNDGTSVRRGRMYFQTSTDAAPNVKMSLNYLGYLGVGNNLYNATAQLDVDQSSVSAAVPALKLKQADVSEEFIRFQGTATAATLTQSIVAEADVSTATRAGFLKVYVTDDGNQITDQAYYMPVYTLS